MKINNYFTNIYEIKKGGNYMYLNTLIAAQATTEPASFTTVCIGLVSSACIIVALWLLVKFTSFLSAKIGNIKADWDAKLKETSFSEFTNTLNVVIDIIKDVVSALNVTMRKELEDATTGKLETEDGKAILNKAIQLIMEQISDEQTEVLSTFIGDIESWVRTKIEVVLEASKNGDK